jgi:hypothetical protein
VKRVALCALACACQLDGSPTPPVELGTFPYHPLVFELDLAIFAYQLHAQSMVWPIDPFYEEQAGPRGTSRDTMMALVRTWAQRRGETQVATGTGVYRGPGVLAGLPTADSHDPILYDYTRLHPWSHAITNNQDQWTEYDTPDAITHRIRDVYVAARAIGTGDVAVTQLAPARIDHDADAADILCAFEGGTGDKGEPDQPASYSLMGFVLARSTDSGGGGYDVHVTFRGSRSGSAFRAATDALSQAQAKGNPDWITDLGYDKVHVTDVSTVGGVARGFARSMRYILPGAFACAEKIAELRGAAPANIFVTGHSLGGGLAQDFASAVLLGDRYSPTGPAMPDAVRGWPWSKLKLVTFSAPRAGDYPWATALAAALDSQVFDPGPIEIADADADIALDPGIVSRLHDTTRPCAFRVLISTDPITTTKAGGDGTHVGTTVYVNGASVIDWLGIDNPDDHEPAKVRQDMVDAFADPRTPPLAWRYLPVTDLVPDRNLDEQGSPAEMEKLARGLLAYYADRDIYFDASAFGRDLELFFAIERGEAN